MLAPQVYTLHVAAVGSCCRGIYVTYFKLGAILSDGGGVVFNTLTLVGSSLPLYYGREWDHAGCIQKRTPGAGSVAEQARAFSSAFLFALMTSPGLGWSLGV